MEMAQQTGGQRAGSPEASTDQSRLDEAVQAGMLIALRAAEAGERMAVTSPTGSRTFAELNARANQLVRGLRAGGVAAGDGVALVCRNRLEFVEVYAAVHRAGLRLTAINSHLTAEEAGYIADDCEAKVLVGDAALGDMIERCAARAPRATVRIAVGGDVAGFERYDDVLAGRDPGDIDDPTLGATMLYTSGTTGRPKGVHRRQAARTTAAGLGIYGYQGEGDAHLCTGPLYHAAPLAFSLAAPLNAGVHVVLMEGWEPEETLRLIERHRVTHTHMVPTMFHRLLALPEEVRGRYDVSSVRFILHGAAPCPVPVKQGIIDWFGPVVHEYYAATEGLGTWVDSNTWLEHPGTVGRAMSPEGIKIRDEQGNDLPAGEVGLVYLKAPDVGRFEYFNDEAKTSSSYLGDYFTLGDVGYLDDDAFLYLTDRTANLIISGGVTSIPPRSTPCSSPIRPWVTPPSSACPTPTGARACSPSSSPPPVWSRRASWPPG
jgi:long-chain acyl-CoA synthetase